MFKHLFIHPKFGFKLKNNVSVVTSKATGKVRHNSEADFKNIKMVICVALLSSLVACSSNSKKTSDENVGLLLSYNERDADKNTYQLEIFINSHYLHISDDNSKDDYVLFDRQKRVIYNVNADDKTIFVIKNRAIDFKPPLEIQYEMSSQPSAAIPEVQGNTATHYRFDVNGKHCYDVVSMEASFMPDAVKAMKEYRNVLAGEHAKSVNNIPKEMLDACDLALNVFYPTKYLDNGLPMREWDRKGYRRFLTQYKSKYKMQEDKLTLPDGYEKYSIGQ